ncbi:MAG: thioredoxin fold domain-containing protein [Rhodobacteraceae bacterium]|nr:thioredoxin fold domain-containing protein [Paracoccaceae bacterium]
MNFFKTLLVFVGISAATSLGAAELGDDGLHKQPWFADTFLDMAEDLAEATEEGKDLLVLFEQKGCPYCRELHEVNFANTEITDFIQEHYLVVQVNMWGDREMTDFDGEVLSEKNLANKWFIQFTPTTIMFTQDGDAPGDVRAAEAFRLPGFLKSFHYASALEYVTSNEYKTLPFQRFVQARAERFEAQGVEVDLWN